MKTTPWLLPVIATTFFASNAAHAADAGHAQSPKLHWSAKIGTGDAASVEH